MSHKTDLEKARKEKEKETGVRQPDPETLHTTDPQNHISSLLQKIEKKAEKNDQQDREDPELQTKK